MTPRKTKQIRLQLEELEPRNAPSAITTGLLVQPPSGVQTHAHSVACQGCEHGIAPHAHVASNGVVLCVPCPTSPC
jgi:hypothetical protein